jgi:hypothetical protein
MRAKREWKQVRSPHARFLEGLEQAVAAHPSAQVRGGANADDGGRGSRATRPRLSVVGSHDDNVIPLPARRDRGRSGDSMPSRRGPRRGGSPAA